MVEYLHKPPGAFYTSTISELVKDPGEKREATTHDAKCLRILVHGICKGHF